MTTKIDRLAALRQWLPEDLDGAMVTSAINRRYYLGFSSSAGTILVTRDQSYFIVDSRYFEAAQARIKNCEVVLQESRVLPQVAKLLEKHQVKRLAIESMAVTVSAMGKYTEAFPGVELANDDRLSLQVGKQRAIKDPWELEQIAAAQSIADRCFTYILDYIKPGRTELEIAVEMEQFCRRQGSEEPAFSYIIAAGKNSSLPHAEPSDNAVASGDFLTMDYGATVNGYRSDMTRTVGVGALDERQKEAYATVLNAQLSSLEAVRAGADCKAVDKVARDIIEASPYKGLFGHGLGHCLGLDVHEEPRLSPLSEAVLEEGMVTSVEPGVYLPGQFGLRIEDIVAVTKTGCRNFCTSPKELVIL